MANVEEPLIPYREIVVLTSEKVKEVVTHSVEIEFPFYTGFSNCDTYPNEYSSDHHIKISRVNGKYEKITVAIRTTGCIINTASIKVELFDACPIDHMDVQRRDSDGIKAEDFEHTRKEVLKYLTGNDYLT